MRGELNEVRQNLLIEEKQRKAVETELHKLKKLVPENDDDFEVSGSMFHFHWILDSCNNPSRLLD